MYIFFGLRIVMAEPGVVTEPAQLLLVPKCFGQRQKAPGPDHHPEDGLPGRIYVRLLGRHHGSPSTIAPPGTPKPGPHALLGLAGNSGGWPSLGAQEAPLSSAAAEPQREKQSNRRVRPRRAVQILPDVRLVIARKKLKLSDVQEAQQARLGQGFGLQQLRRRRLRLRSPQILHRRQPYQNSRRGTGPGQDEGLHGAAALVRVGEQRHQPGPRQGRVY